MSRVYSAAACVRAREFRVGDGRGQAVAPTEAGFLRRHLSRLLFEEGGGEVEGGAFAQDGIESDGATVLFYNQFGD